MAKKSNRQKTKSATRPAAKPVEITPEVEEPVPAAPTAAAEPRAPKAPKVSRSQAAAERIEDEYAYITGDLRRVFILAAVMFALLIVLNIVLSRMG